MKSISDAEEFIHKIFTFIIIITLKFCQVFSNYIWKREKGQNSNQ